MATGDAPDLVLWLHDVRKPGNLGAAVRVAAAAAAALLVTTPDGSRPTPASLLARCRDRRASVGLLDRTTFVCPGDFAAGRAWCSDAGLGVVATMVRDGTAHWDATLTSPIAVLIGNEIGGLSRAHLASADLRVTVPMPGGVESLNAISAASVVLWEALRQRAST